MKNIVIDVHAHFIPRLLYARYDANAAKFPGVRLLRDAGGESHPRLGGTRMQFLGGEPTRPISPKLSDTADRRAWMDKNGIDHQLVGGWLDSFGSRRGLLRKAARSRSCPATRRRAGGEGLAW